MCPNVPGARGTINAPFGSVCTGPYAQICPPRPLSYPPKGAFIVVLVGDLVLDAAGEAEVEEPDARERVLRRLPSMGIPQGGNLPPVVW